MALKFIADENIPFQVVETLREAGYEVAAISEAAHPGMRNDELAKLSIQLGMIILTRDANFTRLRQSLMRKIKVIKRRPEQRSPACLKQHQGMHQHPSRSQCGHAR